jgi:hypothetical protein
MAELVIVKKADSCDSCRMHDIVRKPVAMPGSKVVPYAEMENGPALSAPLHPDHTFVQFDYLLYDCKPQARTLDLIRSALPLERIKYLTAVFSLDPNPVIPYRKVMEIAGLPIADLNRCKTVAAILEGVVDQISENSEDGNLVPLNGRDAFWLNQAYPAQSQSGRKLVPQHAKDFLHIYRFYFERGFFCGYEQIDRIDQGGHMLRCLHYLFTKTNSFLT